MNKIIAHKNSESPWWWIPSLYIAEGLPYFAVNTLTVIMYTNLGVSLTDMAFFTGWLYLPWVIKPFWSPFIDLFKTKRWWIILMQFAMAFGMAGVAFFLPGNRQILQLLDDVFRHRRESGHQRQKGDEHQQDSDGRAQGGLARAPSEFSWLGAPLYVHEWSRTHRAFALLQNDKSARILRLEKNGSRGEAAFSRRFRIITRQNALKKQICEEGQK